MSTHPPLPDQQSLFVTSSNGMTVKVPSSKLNEWEKAQRDNTFEASAHRNAVSEKVLIALRQLHQEALSRKFPVSLPFSHEKSKIPRDVFFARFQSEKNAHPFDPAYLNQPNPYTGVVINSEADYYEYLREHTYHILCDEFCADGLTRSIQETKQQCEAEITAITNSRDSLQRRLESERNDRKIGRRAFLVLLSIVIVLSVLFGVSAKNKAYKSGLIEGEKNGYSAGILELDDAVEKEHSKAYASGEGAGYQSGYSEGQKIGYAEGYGDGEVKGYQNGYSDGLNTHNSYTPQPSTSSGSHSGGDSTGTHRDTPISNSYIGNKRSHKFHLPTCSYLPDQGNQVIFDSRDEAIAAGYSPCGHCNP